MSFMVLGLIFDLMGVFILILVAFLNPRYQKTHTEKWTTRYWWNGFFISKEPRKSIFPKIRMGIKRGCVPPRHQWNLVGFIYIVIGFFLQVTSNFK